LVEKGLIQREDLEKVCPDQPSQDLSVEAQLIQAGLISPEQFRSLAEEFIWNPFCFSVQLSEGADFVRSSLSQFMKESNSSLLA